MTGRRRTKVLEVSKIREILRLSELGLNQSEIAKSANISRSTVQDYLHRASTREVKYQDVLSVEEEVVLKLFGKNKSSPISRAEADYNYLSRELSKKGVTLMLLWQEYIEQHPDGISYSRFCNRYSDWKRANNLSMRQEHKAGEKLYVDYAGVRVPIYRQGTNETLFYAQIFVAVLGASNYTFAEATESQEVKHWIGSHVRCFEFLGGVPKVAVPDNLKSGVKSALFYEPELNPKYCELAQHYGIAVLPTRVRKPKDKSKVEVAVQIVERWILAALRNRKFFCLAELNGEISRLLEKLNAKPMKTYGCSRKELFEAVDKPSLAALPKTPYQFFDYKLARVNIDYHVEVGKHYYSVPYQLSQSEVEIRIKERVIEVFHKGKRVTIHPRSNEEFKHTTKKEHMPPSHQAMLKWTPTRFINWAATIGEQTKLQVETLLNSRQHPEQSYRACLGLLRLSKNVGAARLEAACKRANHLGLKSFRQIRSILDSGLDRIPIIETKSIPTVNHKNLRGSGYYH